MFVARNGRVSGEEVAVGQGFDCQKTRKKPHFTSPNLLFTYPKPHFTYPKPQASALPRTGNTITAMQKQYYRSAEMKCPRCGNWIVCLFIIINRVTLLYTAYHFMRYILNVFAGNLSLSTAPPLRLWHEAADSTGRTASGRSRVFSASMSSLCRVVSVAECEPRSP